ncbi:hypothetical protein P3631_10395 [Vibrio parahaemolyticus]|jgi:hypothetical protein|uniref:Uncharacterized protein n=1 Tax=Vibrio diazotrophicus TaxID=685 RepID=A0A2J8GTE7_VIBDI|nr:MULTISPECIES: hypothetical protein [Vibrio]EJE4205433.1 hypothetical protein [Vibrio parahaemolyticus]MCR9664814.1 hypothetical protein [Vibrio parahaemolyticus]MCR9679776.1 hypothetical protein [Vibrio parahaemolyticus]MCR9877683.1 hypothetical protein [Vibrio parahaemolyticus]MCR9894295.1 hypothetical protein [Vibrio parahaemolyticus]
MKRSTKISAMMHKLLIEKEMDGFSVVELRDAFISTDNSGTDPDEARRMVYRQIRRFTNNSWLITEGKGQKKRYFQTNLFKGLQVKPKTLTTRLGLSSSPDYSVLICERNQYKAELEIVLSEIDEYQSVIRRFQKLEIKLTPLLEQAKERSAQLLGKVNVLTNALNALSEETASC